MKTRMNWMALVAAVALSAGWSADADARVVMHRHHPHGPKPVMVVRPAVAPRAHGERVSLAMNYLARHRYLTARQYARLTGLSVRAAAAELDALARDRRPVVVAATRGKTRVYIKR